MECQWKKRQHWIDLSAAIVAPFVTNPLVNAYRIPAFRSSIQLDEEDDMISTFNTEFMPRDSPNFHPQLAQVEHLIRQELHLGSDVCITYQLCRDLDSTIQDLPSTSFRRRFEFGRSHCRSLFPRLSDIGLLCANARISTMLPIIGYTWQPTAVNSPHHWIRSPRNCNPLKSAAIIADKHVSLVHIKDWDGMERMKYLEKFVLFVHPAHLFLSD